MQRAGGTLLGGLFGRKKPPGGAQGAQHPQGGIHKAAASASAVLPPDTLPSDAVVTQFFGHMGVPGNSDAVAYDADQKLLAVSTDDGRVKVFGSPGVELLFVSSSRSGTQRLVFIPSRPGILRIAKDGLVEVFSLIPPYEVCGAVSSLKERSDPPLCVEFWPLEDARDLVLLGCDSGAMRAAQLQPGPISGGNPAAVIRGLKLMPYSVSPSQWGGPELDGGVLCLSRQPGGDGDCLLVAHRDGLVVWSLRYAGASANLHRRGLKGDRQDLFEEVGALQTACWSALDGSAIASAHNNGDVLLWRLPDHALPGASPPPGSDVREGRLELVRILRVSSDDCTHGIDAIFLLSEHRLLVRGGQSIVEPEALAVLHTDSSENSDDESEVGWEPTDGALPQGEICCEMTFLPWFGPICGVELVSGGSSTPGGAAEKEPDARILLALGEGGQLIVHRIGASPEASMIAVSSQSHGEVSHLSWLQRFPGPPVSGKGHGHSGRLALCVDDFAALRASEDGADPAGGRWSWLTEGGEGFDPRAPGAAGGGPGEDDMLATGHADGRCVLWDGRARVPRCAAVVPAARGAFTSNSSGGGEALAPVTAVAMCWMAGILAVGHRDGTVRLYQWSSSARDITPLSANLHGSRPRDQDAPEHLEPGFHLIMTSDVHAGEAVAQIALGTAHHLVAFGDSAGNVSLFDLGGGAFLFMLPVAAEGGVKALHFGAPAASSSSSGPSGSTAPSRTTAAAAAAAAASGPNSPVHRPDGAPSAAATKSKAAKEPSWMPPVASWGSRASAAAPRAELVLYCLLQDFSVAVVDCASSRVVLSSPCPAPSPKEGYKAVLLHPLDDSGTPQPPPTAAMKLQWVDALEVTFEAQLKSVEHQPRNLPGTDTGSQGEPPEAPRAGGHEQHQQADRDSGAELHESGGGGRDQVQQKHQQDGDHDGGDGAEDSGSDSGSDSDMLAAAVEAAEASAPREESSDEAPEGKGKHHGGHKGRGFHAMGSFGRNMGKNVGLNLKKVFKPRRQSATDEPDSPTNDASEPAAEDLSSTESSSRAPEAADQKQQQQQQSLDQQAPEQQGSVSKVLPRPESAGENAQGASSVLSAVPTRLSKAQTDGPESPKTPSSPPGSDSSSGGNSVATFEVQDKARWTTYLLLVSNERAEVCPATDMGGGSSGAVRDVYAEVVFPPELRCVRATTFSSAEGAGVAVLTASNQALQMVIYSLPRLTSVLAVHLEYCLGWPLQGAWQGFAASGPEGQLALASTTGELVRLGLVGAVSLKPPTSVFDAAAAAGPRKLQLELIAAAAASDPQDTSPRHRRESDDGAKTKGLFSGLEKLGGDLMKTVGMAPGKRQPMDLGERFSRSVAAPAQPGSRAPRQRHEHLGAIGDISIDSIEVDGIDDPAVDTVRVSADRGRTAPPPAARVEVHDWEQRAQQGSAAQAPRVRTADEIKQKYRKPKDAQSSATATQSVMNENMRKLNERGERLSKLQDKTAAMEDNAKGFADMAKEIRDREANRKWWQL